jgi:hypothetical protein
MAYTPHRRRKHDPEATRRALELLADAGVGGCSEAVLLAHRFTIDQLANWSTPRSPRRRRSASKRAARRCAAGGAREVMKHGEKGTRNLSLVASVAVGTLDWIFGLQS